MIYDCFTFFNELELLELRLGELSNVVDKFVLVEGTKTFRGKNKPLYFQENKDKYPRFLDRIIHVVVDDFPESSNPWVLEYHQRNMIARGLANCQADDVIIISDVDEIPDPRKITEYKQTRGVKIFAQRLFYYFLNCVAIYGGKEYRCLGPVMTRYRDLTTPQAMRDLAIGIARLDSPRIPKTLRPWLFSIGLRPYALISGVRKRRRLILVETGGWHFSFIGGVNRMVEKIEAFSHSECDTSEIKDPTRIREAIDKGRDLFGRDLRFKCVSVDETFPSYLRNNIERFAPFIKGR